MAIQEDMTTDLRPKMASLAVPVTVIYEVPLANLIQSDYAPVPNKTLIAAAPGAKHFIMFDDPAGFDAAVDGFLKR
jgi:pimeloyl-ACP methyl ester carboxylesterase